MYNVEQKSAPFYFCNNFVKPHCILIIIFEVNLQQNCNIIAHLSWWMLLPYLVKYNTSFCSWCTAHQWCLTSLAVSHKCIPEWLSIICNLQNWGVVCWEDDHVWCEVRSLVSQQLSALSALESKSRQQLDRCLAANVWAARHHSNNFYAPFNFTPGCMKITPVQQSQETPTETDKLSHTGTCLSETSEGRLWAEAASDWNVVSNQQSFIDQAIDP